MGSVVAPGEPASLAAVEREAKLLAPAGFVLPCLDDLVPGSAVIAVLPRRLAATYYDTAGLNLARSGITLRCRRGESGPPWTVKLPDGASRTALAGREIRFAGPPGHVPEPVGDLVLAATRARCLEPVARISTVRSATQIRDGSGRLLAEIDDDAVTVSAPQRRQTTFREARVEVAHDAPTAGPLLRAALARLVEAGCVVQAPVPELVRALGIAATPPADVVVAPLREPATLSDLVGHTIARSIAQILRHDPGVRLGTDDEDVHQLRVATRRLRSDLRTFARQLDAKRVGVREELGWLAGAVGAVRDTDVLTARLRSTSETLPDADGAAVAALMSRLAQQTETARAAMLAAMRSPRYLRLLDDLVALAATPPAAVGAARTTNTPARVAARMVRRPWQHLAGALAALPRDPSDAALHRIRILAKRCRYAAEATAPLNGPPAERFAAAMADVQTVLGDHQDTVVAEAWLREAAAAEPTTGVAAGELIAVERVRRGELRAQWPAAWRSATTKKLKAWMYR